MNFVTFTIATYHVKLYSFSPQELQVRLEVRVREAESGRHFLDIVQEFEDDMVWEGDEDFAIYVQEGA